jgi:hypothetical protein
MVIKKTILYFPEPGEENSDITLKAAKERANELGIRDIVISSSIGGTALKALEVFKGFNMVIVTHVTGYKDPGVQELSEEIQERIKKGGGKILTAAHAFSGVSKAIQTKFNTVYPTGIIAQSLRILCQGMKVIVEITAMASDAGLIPANKDIVVVAGSHRGANTAAVVKPANSHNLFDMIVKEIICKPSNF